MDDAPDTRSLYDTALRRCGATVITAASGVQASACMRENQVDIMVSDLCMSDGDGFELMESLRALDEGQRPTITAAISALGESASLRAISAGYDHYIAKPISLVDFLTEMEALALRARQRRSEAVMLD